MWSSPKAQPRSAAGGGTAREEPKGGQLQGEGLEMKLEGTSQMCGPLKSQLGKWGMRRAKKDAVGWTRVPEPKTFLKDGVGTTVNNGGIVRKSYTLIC